MKLIETLNDIDNSSQEISEVSPKDLSNILKTAGRTEEQVLSVLAGLFKTDVRFLKLANAKELSVLNKELNNAIKADFKEGVRVSNTNILGPKAKEASKMLTTKEIMQHQGNLTEKQIIDIIERNKINSKNIASKIEKTTLSKVTNTTNGAKGGTKGAVSFGKNVWSKMVNGGKKLTTKWKYALGLAGLAGVAAYATKPGDAPNPNETLPSLPECLTGLLNNDGSTFNATTSGDPVIIVKNYGEEGELTFYSNGRVFNSDRTKRGKWSCDGGTITSQPVNESVVLNEQKVITRNEMANDVNNVIDYFDFPVYGNDLKNAFNTLSKYKNATVNGKPAGPQFLSLYQQSGLGGGDINKTLRYINTSDANSTLLKNDIVKLVAELSSGVISKTGGEQTGGGGLKIIWDNQPNPTTPNPTNGTNTPTTPKQSKQQFHDCESKGFPLEYGCRSSKIKEIQSCLGMESRYQTGNFGTITKGELTKSGYDLSQGLTQQIYDSVKQNCQSGDPNGEIKKRERADTISPTQPGDAPQTIDPNLKPMIDVVDSPDKTSQEKLQQLLNADVLNKDAGGRIKYRSGDLSQDALDALNKILNDNGYMFKKITDLGVKRKTGEDRDKYVWIKDNIKERPLNENVIKNIVKKRLLSALK